jgi:hypothetical protein
MEVRGFEGNAQSFRILTHLRTRSLAYHGLNLTKGTLRALLKYFWIYSNRPDDTTHETGKKPKWGAYDCDRDTFSWLWPNGNGGPIVPKTRSGRVIGLSDKRSPARDRSASDHPSAGPMAKTIRCWPSSRCRRSHSANAVDESCFPRSSSSTSIGAVRALSRSTTQTAPRSSGKSVLRPARMAAHALDTQPPAHRIVRFFLGLQQRLM